MSSSSSSCRRCHEPLAVDSASGLCDVCSKAAETSREEGTPGSEPIGNKTRSQGVSSEAETFTAGFEFSVDTQAWGQRGKLPSAPAGYDLYRYLGGGGMGAVYLAHEHAAERTVAMKFLRASANAKSHDRFLTEIRSLARLEHPNIVRVIAVDLNRPEPYFTMEYAPAGTLADKIKAEGPLEPREAAGLIIQLADAVQAAHAANILHRDLKPSNVVIAADGTPKVSDFGLAKRLDLDDSLTYTSQAIGTPAFMPPEQVSREYGDFSAASDVYGLGATLYYMLTGRVPYDGSSAEEILPKVRNSLPTRPRALRPDLPLGLEAIVLKCLEKSPGNRYASAEKLARDLEKFLAGKNPDAPTMTRGRRFRKWCGRNRVAMLAGFLGIGCIFAIAIIGSGYASRNVLTRTPEFIRNELAAGRSVVLVDATGLPGYHQYPFETVTLGKSPHKDGSCYFQAFHYGLVELAPSPGIPRYRVDLELRHVQSKAADARQAYIGFYFGHATGTADNEPTVHAMFAATYTDGPATGWRLPAGQSPVYFRKLGFYQSEDVVLDSLSTKSDDFIPFERHTDLPGPWRFVSAEISPEQIHVSWKTSRDSPEQTLILWSGEEAHTRYEKLKSSLAGRAPLASRAVPAWSTDTPFGVMAVQAGMTVRNVVIHPRLNK